MKLNLLNALCAWNSRWNSILTEKRFMYCVLVSGKKEVNLPYVFQYSTYSICQWKQTSRWLLYVTGTFIHTVHSLNMLWEHVHSLYQSFTKTQEGQAHLFLTNVITSRMFFCGGYIHSRILHQYRNFISYYVYHLYQFWSALSGLENENCAK